MFVGSLTWRGFVLAKSPLDFICKLVGHHAQSRQSPVRKFLMLTVWPSIAEGFPTQCSFTSKIYKKVNNFQMLVNCSWLV